jgi:hypothetical protein
MIIIGLIWLLIVVVVLTIGLVNRYHWQKKQRMTMVDGIADDGWVGVKYGGMIIPMRYFEYLTLWKSMTRKEKREMVVKIKKSVDKGKVHKSTTSIFEDIIDDNEE